MTTLLDAASPPAEPAKPARQFPWVRFDGLGAIRPVDRPSICEVREGGVPFQFFLDPKPGSTILMVFGQGYTDRRTLTLPRFQRLNWAGEFPHSVLIINDPTLYLREDVGLGWCLGTAGNHYLPTMCRIVTRFAAALGIPEGRVVFWGSSAGGFTSMMMAARVPGSVAVVNNPQTDVLKFRRPGVNHLLKVAFGGISSEEAGRRWPERFRVIEQLSRAAILPSIYYLQNVCDVDHWEDHCLPFTQAFGELVRERGATAPRFILDLYRDEAALHNPVGLARTRACLQTACGWLDEA